MNSDHNIDRVIAKRYRLVEVIGTGAMGQVYRAQDQLLGNTNVAVKFLSQTLLNEKMRERFEREATICANLAEKSIHIVGVRDYGIDENKVPYYIMEFLQGRALKDIIQEEEEIPVSRFLSLCRQICLGLDCAHKGIIFKGQLSPIIHRDVKPSNIYVIQDPTIGELVKVLDFGIAKLIESSDSQTHSFMGTLAYCSPEQMEGKELDNRSDIYSLGIMMYEMLTNEMPILPETSSFPGWYKAHHELPPKPFNPRLNISQDLQNLIFKCLAKKPKARFQSISEMLPIIERLSHQVQQPHREVKTEPKPGDISPSLPSSPKKSPPNSANITDVEAFYLKATWPLDKPQQKIVFPKIMSVGNEIYPTLWAMLEKEDIMSRISSIRYNQFLYLESPHPMVLWITALYHQEHGPCWLPCYLDFKTDNGLEIGSLLAKIGNYAMLFFPLNDNQQCNHVMKITIAAKQRQLLQQWSQGASEIRHYGKHQISKHILKQEFEKIKPKIVEKLVKIRASQSSN